jgi:hypothetical protein
VIRDSLVLIADSRFSVLESRITNLTAAVVFRQNSAFVPACYGSPKTQNLKDAATHTESLPSLAGAAAEQVPAMRQHGGVAHRLSFLWVLQRAAGVDGGSVKR